MRPAVIEGVVEPALLLLLSEHDDYGYSLATEIEARGLVPQSVTAARIYEVLMRLEADGAASSEQEGSPAGPDRRRYALTPAGRVRLDRWAQALRPSARSLTALLTTYDRGRKARTAKRPR